MDRQKKEDLEAWIEDVVYSFFDQMQKRGAYPTIPETTQIAPFLQMYHALQLKEVASELSALGSTFYDGSASVAVHPTFNGFDINVNKMPKEGKEK